MTAELLATLTPREREALGLIAAGLPRAQIAEQMGVSIKTVETYRTRVGTKLGATSRAELIRFALDHGLLK